MWGGLGGVVCNGGRTWKLLLERQKSQSMQELPINGKLVIGERSELRTASGGREEI